MRSLFRNHSALSPVWKHKELPVLKTEEFDFYRCVKFDDTFYKKTVSELHSGNLRLNTEEGRYSKLFSGMKVSYWADGVETARAEVKRHGSGNNLLTFHAYDDASSTFPTVFPREILTIIDGRELDFLDVLNKVEGNKMLSTKDEALVARIMRQDADCLAYNSHAKSGAINFLFFEKGFRKLSLRSVKLRLGDTPGKNNNTVRCAYSSDYVPYPEAYGKCFKPLAKIGINPCYLTNQEYIQRKMYLELSKKELRDYLHTR